MDQAHAHFAGFIYSRAGASSVSLRWVPLQRTTAGSGQVRRPASVRWERRALSECEHHHPVGHAAGAAFLIDALDGDRAEPGCPLATSWPPGRAQTRTSASRRRGLQIRAPRGGAARRGTCLASGRISVQHVPGRSAPVTRSPARVVVFSAPFGPRKTTTSCGPARPSSVSRRGRSPATLVTFTRCQRNDASPLAGTY
jgi:hypothetical protein